MIYRADILHGDARDRLRELSPESVQCCISSPPYWGLRDYGVAGQLGLERTPEEYVAKMVEVFREVRRVLRPDGTLWLNLGDSYAGATANGGQSDFSTSGLKRDGRSEESRVKTLTANAKELSRAQPVVRRDIEGLKPKDLVGIPWRVAFALQADGWWLRSDIVWSKPNPMPESVTDRPTKAHEYLFLLSKSASYFYDADAIRESFADERMGNPGAYDRTTQASKGANNERGDLGFLNGGGGWNTDGSAQGRNRRTVWTIATQPFPGAHFAVMPEALVKPCVLAGTSEKGACVACGAPWERQTERIGGERYATGKSAEKNGAGLATAFSGYTDGSSAPTFVTKGWAPSCACAAPHRPCVVLDPFAGAGTVGVVALKHGRAFVGVELNPKYAAMAQDRIVGDAPLLNRIGQLQLEGPENSGKETA